MDTHRRKEEAGSAWRWLAEGWHNISSHCANALTYFSPAHPEQYPADMRWGVLAVDVNEREDCFVIELEAPGLDKEAIDITLDEHHVVVTATKRYGKEREDGAMRISERAFGSFQRTIPMPVRVRAKDATASYERGVLALRVMKATPPGARKISVSISDG